jgi:hypothetical protein
MIQSSRKRAVKEQLKKNLTDEKLSIHFEDIQKNDKLEDMISKSDYFSDSMLIDEIILTTPVKAKQDSPNKPH